MKNEDEETDIYEFICKLRQERLFIKSEKLDIQELNELIKNKTQTVIKASWLTNKQRLLLFERRISSQNCQKFDFIHNSDFVEAKNTLGFQNAIKISNLLHILRSQPKQLAHWLITGESIVEDNIQYPLMLQSVLNGLYGGCIFADDTKYLLTLLLELAKKQLLKSDNPRRLIKQRSCSFRHLYVLFHEIYQPAKFFLSAALEMPILELLSYSEGFLDVDHDQSIMRFRQDATLQKYKDAVEYRNEVVSKLAQFTNSFIQSLMENVYSFPRAMAWIACHIHALMEKNFCSKEANAVTTDLIFTLFICPVIVDPEQYGMFNSTTSEMARHNLIQIGKILQILALCKFEGIEKKYFDIFDNIDKNSMNNFVDLLFFDMDSSEPPVETTPEVVRDIMLFTEEELNNLICFLQKVQILRIQNDDFEKNPSLSVSIEEHLSSLTVSSRDSSPKATRPNGEIGEFSPSNNCNNVAKKPPFFSLGSLGTHKNSHSGGRRSTEDDQRPQQLAVHKNTVTVFPIDGVISEPVGLLPEDKVIDLSVPVKNDSVGGGAVVPFDPSSPSSRICKDDDLLDAAGVGKANYSGYADEGSIGGNTSDNLEAISEAASNHSVASSLELEENEDQNDNLSDMVSANVSGRGTPNISGRDTPSSQVNDGDQLNIDAQPPSHHQNQLNGQQQSSNNVNNSSSSNGNSASNISRQRRSEIVDKFCKFEIKRLMEGDETTVSIISETWSTDVLASDTETEQPTTRHAVAATAPAHHLLLQHDQQTIQQQQADNVLDLSETQSEGAWSTDVMTSDTERLTEVDNDDAASVAQSDDTNSVARSDETDEAASARRLSTCSSSYGGAPPMNYAGNVMGGSGYVSATNGGAFKPPINYKSSNEAPSSAFHEFKKRGDGRINGKIAAEVDGNANNLFKPVLVVQHQQQQQLQLQQGVSQSTQTTVSFNSVTTNAFVPKTRSSQKTSESMPGPSGLNGETDQSYMMKQQNSIMKKFGDRATEILLSNCSLNSSSSGSSSNSFENKTSAADTSDQWETKPWLNSSGSSLNVTLTPSESTSELSVLSVSNPGAHNPAGAIKRGAAGRSLKPSASTGAIPKSISFDMSADKGLDDDTRSKRGGFFGRLRKGFRNKKPTSFRNQEEIPNGDVAEEFKRGRGDSPVRVGVAADSSDDILAKYRKPYAEASPIKENGLAKKPTRNATDDGLSPETNSFTDIKKKLRIVLGNTSEIPYYVKTNPCTMKVKLETILRLELGKTRKLREWSAAARVAEALRCVQLLDETRCLKLLESLRDDSKLRAIYLRYLVASKQDLLFTEMYLNSLHDQIKHDRFQCEMHFAAMCVQEFLAEQDVSVAAFCDEFRHLSLADEKCDALQNFYQRLYEVMNESKHWKDVLHKRGSLIKVTLERYIISRIYYNAIYPNGDGDRDRDKVLHDHIATLSKTLRPEHKYLLIPAAYLRESPWLPAQEALRALDAARAPRDKLRCVSRCAKCLVDLLGLAGSCAAADDFTPVLVYVIIKVNPQALLSTIQFVNSFHAGQIRGEDEYWWTQFCSAVEYIKTMDYTD